ncbi:GHMP kinase [Pavlovales sp. CCMP2436]|nr:GHMP kinase [Pavlovales sp. CCMP2436]
MEVYEGAEEALKACDWKKLGELADKNHALLQELTVSCAELDTLVVAARSAGALGAKLAGTGRGGLMWAICADKKSQDAVAEALGKISPQRQQWWGVGRWAASMGGAAVGQAPGWRAWRRAVGLNPT